MYCFKYNDNNCDDKITKLCTFSKLQYFILNKFKKYILNKFDLRSCCYNNHNIYDYNIIPVEKSELPVLEKYIEIGINQGLYTLLKKYIIQAILYHSIKNSILYIKDYVLQNISQVALEQFDEHDISLILLNKLTNYYTKLPEIINNTLNYIWKNHQFVEFNLIEYIIDYIKYPNQIVPPPDCFTVNTEDTYIICDTNNDPYLRKVLLKIYKLALRDKMYIYLNPLIYMPKNHMLLVFVRNSQSLEYDSDEN
jgi:hypothetical protein